MTTSVLSSDQFWRETLERAGRQLAQTLVPVLLEGLGDPRHRLDAVSIAMVAGIAVALTVIKALAGIRPHPLEAWYWQLLDRGVPAAAGTALGFLSVDVANLDSVDWSRAGVACLGAGILAILAYYATPPTSAVVVGPPPAIVTPPLPPDLIHDPELDAAMPTVPLIADPLGEPKSAVHPTLDTPPQGIRKL